MNAFCEVNECATALHGPLLDPLLPMHVRVGRDGRILHVGPTFLKMCGHAAPAGRVLFDVLEIRRPSGIGDMTSLLAAAGQRLTVALGSAPELPLHGVVAALPRNAGALIDISLGLSFDRAVARFGLTVSDFSPCDQTVELLYLREANAAIGRLSRQLTERLSAARNAAEQQALTDPLTGLANRRAMDATLARLLADPSRCFSLLHLDLDFFKQVNDTNGHAAGDRVLVAMAETLRREVRDKDMVARVGGDEFLVVLRDTVTAKSVASVASRLIRQIEMPVDCGGAVCVVSASIGIAPTAAYRSKPTAGRLLADADAALYRAKEAGRARFAIHGLDSPPSRPIDDANGA